MIGIQTRERGAGLIIVIMVVAFMFSMGIAMMTITTTGKRVADNVRSQKQAFNAAEAGFDAAWALLNERFTSEAWASFEGQTLVDPSGIDLPSSTFYFRTRTDLEIFALLDVNGDGNPDYGNILFYRQTYYRNSQGQLDSRFTYTVFLIDDEAGIGSSDATDVLLVCIGTFGVGDTVTTARIEVELAN
ncbi:MAG: hypothetical protein KJ874_05415 [Acidobacteria bacterium]|nr:hypothetical protein [Acidobacteriota bacterium]